MTDRAIISSAMQYQDRREWSIKAPEAYRLAVTRPNDPNLKFFMKCIKHMKKQYLNMR